MNAKKLFLICILGLSACNTTPPALPPAVTAEHAVVMPSKEEMMAKWKEYSTPGESHKALDALVGKWKYTMQWWMDQGTPPEITKGTASIRWILGKRFVEQIVLGTFMGQPFEGRGIFGYDNATKLYQTLWIDNSGTGMMLGSGMFDQKANVFSESGKVSCPINGTMPYRAATTLIDTNHFRYELFMTAPNASESRVMSIEYARVK